jgi:GntR family transcriptional repressor for pyruvate dehydrogenase complex
MMQQQQIAKVRIYEQIAMQLQQEIAFGHLAPGERLPAERDLAARFGVSRASVREALTALQAQGLVETRQGGGTIVRTTPETHAGSTLGDILARSGAATRNPLEVRAIFEPQTAFLAAERATSAEIAAMRDLLRAQEASVAAGGLGIDDDTAFHFAVAQASHNDLIVTIVGYINEALRETREWSMRAPSGTTYSLHYHHRILAAIAERDAQAAQLAMAEHLRSVQSLALQWIQERAQDLALAPS